MESIGRLRLVLLNAIAGRGAGHTEQELFDELMIHKPSLLNLFDVGARSQQEQRELESGLASGLSSTRQNLTVSQGKRF